MGISDTLTGNGYVVELDPDRSIVYAETSALNGGLISSAGGAYVNWSNSAMAFPYNSDGIDAAIARIVASGAPGVVVFAAEAYAVTRDHLLVSGVSFAGTPLQMQFGVADNVPDFWTPSARGTRLNLAAGVTGLKWNATDQGSVQSPLMSFALTQSHIYGLAFVGGERAIKIGAVNAQGCVDGSIDMVYAYNQACADGGYAIDIQNSQFFHTGRVRVSNDQADSIGGNFRVMSSLPSAVLLPGDSHINEVFSRVTSRTRRGVTIEAGGATVAILNDIKITGRIHSSRYSTSTPATVSLVTTSGSANVSVPDAGQFALCTVGMPLRFQSTGPSAFDAAVTYFVASRNTGASTITLAEADYGAATTPTASGTYAMFCAGYPTFIARADAGCAVKNSNFGDLACEVTGNIGAVMFSKTRNCNANLNNPSNSHTGTGVILRDAEMGITYSGSTLVGHDESALSSSTVGFVNLAAGDYSYSGSSFTLDSSWNGRRVRYSGASDITITIPRKLPAGFTLDVITTHATAVVTFVGASGLGLWSRTGLRTAGQYARARLIKVSSIGYHLSGDLQV